MSTRYDVAIHFNESIELDGVSVTEFAEDDKRITSEIIDQFDVLMDNMGDLEIDDFDEWVRPYMGDLIRKAAGVVTIITMYRGHDAESFVQAVKGKMTDEQKDTWRKAHACDDYHPGGQDDEDLSNMFFREVELLESGTTSDLLNIDGEGPAG